MRIAVRSPFRVPRSAFWWAVLVAVLTSARSTHAHPVPFSYIDVRVNGRAIEVSVVAHAWDLIHDLELGPETTDERFLDPATLQTHAAAIAAIFGSRLRVEADGRTLTAEPWSAPEALMDRLSVRLRAQYDAPGPPGIVRISAAMFPYDPMHQTFLNVYEDTQLRAQAILSAERPAFEHFAGTRQGAWAVVRRFLPSGIHHILIGPDHLLFLVGLLLLGGTLKRLVLVVSAFTVAHSVTLTLAALNIVTPPASVIEPAIALSIVYVGIDNLMVRGGRDMRAWIAFAFGFIHGFGFANVLREMDLPSRALGWSLFSFNLGVEVGQLVVVVAVASILAAVRNRSAIAGKRVVVAGSWVVIAAGAFWFVERVFFPGGLL
jgi:hydrogenase/urease accessory protein HupE